VRLAIASRVLATAGASLVFGAVDLIGFVAHSAPDWRSCPMSSADVKPLKGM